MPHELPQRLSPRISVNDLALFIVSSSSTAQLGIIRRAKSPSKPPIMRYKDARPAICTYLSDANRRVNPLTAAEEMLRQRSRDPSASSLAKDDALKSIEVLHGIQRMANALTQFDFQTAPKSQAKLTIQAVEISTRADLLVLGSSRGRDQYGCAILRMTVDDAESESAKSKRREMGLYVATVARVHAEQNLAMDRQLSNRLCMSIDVQHGELFQAPESNTRRMNEVENACRIIAGMWDRV